MTKASQSKQVFHPNRPEFDRPPDTFLERIIGKTTERSFFWRAEASWFIYETRPLPITFATGESELRRDTTNKHKRATEQPVEIVVPAPSGCPRMVAPSLDLCGKMAV